MRKREKRRAIQLIFPSGGRGGKDFLSSFFGGVTERRLTRAVRRDADGPCQIDIPATSLAVFICNRVRDPFKAFRRTFPLCEALDCFLSLKNVMAGQRKAFRLADVSGEKSLNAAS